MPPTRSRSRQFCIGIDLGGTNMQIGVVDSAAKIRGTSRKKTRADEGSAAVIDRLVRSVQEACEDAGITTRQLKAIGIGAPGAVDPVSGIVLEAVNLNWTNYRLASVLTAKLKVPVFLDNDVNVAVLGEQRLGAAKGAQDLLGVWVGTGIGGGLILNGQLYYGGFKTAGEIGHTWLYPGNPPGSRTLENNCSRSNVVQRLSRLIASNRKSILPKLAVFVVRPALAESLRSANRTSKG